MAEVPSGVDGAELELLRAGVRLMALHALGRAELADEVAQETLVRAFHSLRASRPDNLGAFVGGIARHVIADIIRARPREVPLDGLAPEAEPRTSRDPLVELCDAAERDQVHAALGLLTPDDRELLRLVFFEGLSPSAIAGRLGAPSERIRQRKLRALARLRVAFDAAGASRPPRHDGRPGATTEEGPTGTLTP